MKRNNYNIFTGGTKVSKHTTNGQPLWANRSALQSSGDMEPQQVDRPPPAPDVFQEREGAGGMRVGRDYQARIPTPIPKPEQNRQADADKALLVWSPSDRMTEAQLDNYLDVAKTKYHYTWEQALGLLFWHRYDVGRALQDLGNFTPHPEDWTIEDKVLFEQAFQFHGKAFDRIRQMLPEKSMSSLIRYYYKWKKCRSRNSVMDRQAKRFNHGREDGDEITPGLPLSNSFPTPAHHPGGLSQVKDVFSNGHQRHGCSDSDDDILKRSGGSGKICENCGVPCAQLHTKDRMCNTCFLYWKKTGEYRPLTGPLRRGERQVLGILRQRRAPPKGMYINHDDLSVLASATPQAENVTLFGLEREVLDMKCRVQTMKQDVEMIKRKLPEGGIDKYRPKESPTSLSSPRVNARWTQEELMLAAQGVRRYGKDFTKIAELLQTKNEGHLKSFYANYRKRFGLDSLVEEHQSEAQDDCSLSFSDLPDEDAASTDAMGLPV